MISRKSPRSRNTSRKATSREQVSGYKFQVERITHAFVQRDSRGLKGALTSKGIYTSSLVLVFGTIIIALFVRLLSPQAVGDNENRFFISKDGGQYVLLDRVIHPVTNSISAKLILTRNEKPKTVSYKSLLKYPQGGLVGLPSAPENVYVLGNKENRGYINFSICSFQDRTKLLDLENQIKVETTFTTADIGVEISEKKGIPGRNQKLNPKSISDLKLLKKDEYLFVRTRDSFWIIKNNFKMTIPIKDGDTSLYLEALGINYDSGISTNSAAPTEIPYVSEETLSLYSPIPKPSLVNIKNDTEEMTPDGFRVNSILRVPRFLNTRDSDFYFVFKDGVENIPDTFAHYLSLKGYKTFDAEEIVLKNVNRVSYFQAGEVFPKSSDKLLTPYGICTTWSKNVAEGSLAKTVTMYSFENPVSEVIQKNRNISTGFNPGDGVIYFYFPKGLFLRGTELEFDSTSEESLFWLDPSGGKYDIGTDLKYQYEPVLKSLGLDSQKPNLAPMQFLEKVPTFGSLSPQAAMIEHGFIPPDDSIRHLDNPEDEISTEETEPGRGDK